MGQPQPDRAFYESPDDFEKLKELSKGSEQWENVISQLSPWAEECFENNTVFTICGI